jgi:outer membrane protein assembly factor BamA
MKGFCLLFWAISGIFFHQVAKAQTEAIIPLPDSLKKIVITDLVASGNKKTKDYIIFREMTFQKGDTLLLKDLEEETERSRKNIFNSTLFNEVSVVPVKMKENEYDVFVTVKERWYIIPLPQFRLVDRNFYEWWNNQNRDLARTIYGVKFSHNNFSGRRDPLKIYLLNGYSQQVQFNYSQPFSDRNLKHGFSVNMAYSRTREVNYSTRFDKQLFVKAKAGNNFLRRNFRADLGYSYRGGLYGRHSIRLGYISDDYSDTVLALNSNFLPGNKSNQRFPELSYNYNYAKLDYTYYPLQGAYYGFSVFKRGLGRYMNLTQFSASGGKYFDLVKKWKLYAGVQAAGSIKLPFKQPFYNTGMFGFGEFYPRGLELYVIDGVAAALLRTTVRKQVLNTNLNVKFLKWKSLSKIPIKVYLKGYSDLGYSYLPNAGPTNRLNNRTLYTYGAGIDIVTIYDYVFRFEFSFNQLGDRGFYVK